MSNAPNHHIETDVKSLQMWIWDLGPTAPEAPKPPVAPKGKDGDPEYEIAKIEFAETLKDYTADLERFRQARKEHKEWHEKNGGPVQIQFWSRDAKDAMERDPKRYVAKLPRGVKPGKAHQENLDRQAAIADDHAREASRDPYFGVKAEGAPA